jgi:hypothetical protein
MPHEAPLPGMERQPLRTCDIRRIVQERLSGFLVRQAERDAIRAKKRRRKSPVDDFQEVLFHADRDKGQSKPIGSTAMVSHPGVRARSVGYAEVAPQAGQIADLPAMRKLEESPEMKSPIVFRASFEGLKSTTFRLPGLIEVEIFHAKIDSPQWRARRPGTRIEFNFTPQSTAETLRNQVELLYFDRRVTDWEAYDSLPPERKLGPSDWATDKDGKVYLTQSYIEKLQAEETARKQNTVTK